MGETAPELHMSDATQPQSNSSFDPEALRILSMALDDAWDRIKNSGSTLARPSYARADAGKIIREVKVASEPDGLLQVLRNPAYCFKRIGLEAGPLSQWLFSALGDANLPVICVETRHMRAVLKAQINKTDRNDARGIAQMMRVGLYRPVHVKTLRSQKLRMLLTHRKLLQSKAIAIENDLRATLRNFGLKVGKVKFEMRIKELVENQPDLRALVEPLLIVRR